MLLTTIFVTALFALDTAPERQLDFWIGEWKLDGKSYDAQGKATKTSSTNSIKSAFDGHVIQENFSQDGYKGMSVSVFDPRSKLWKQTWVDNQGSYIALEGKFENNAMTLFTKAGPKKPGAYNRMLFNNIKADSFDWHWDATSDDGKTWKPVWEIHYTRAK